MADTENGAMVMAVLAVPVLLACRVRELWCWLDGVAGADLAGLDGLVGADFGEHK